MNLRELYKTAISKLSKAGIESAEAEARIMLDEISGKDFAWLFLHAEAEASPGQLSLLEDMLNRRASGEPLQYIMGKVDFMGIEIAVGPGVLIPRPETEGLCELAEREAITFYDCTVKKGSNTFRAHTPSLRFLDLCTGSGCIAARLANRFFESEVAACDISVVALEFARRNCPERVKIFGGDLFEAIPVGEEAYDIIISNPPYIPSAAIAELEAQVKAWEPVIALDGGESGMDTVSRIIKEAPGFLQPGGLLLMEIDESEGSAALREASLTGAYEDFEIHKDLNGKDRYLRAKLRRTIFETELAEFHI